MLDADATTLAEAIYDAAIAKAVPGDIAYRPFATLSEADQKQFTDTAAEILDRTFDLTAAQIVTAAQMEADLEANYPDCNDADTDRADDVVSDVACPRGRGLSHPTTM